MNKLNLLSIENRIILPPLDKALNFMEITWNNIQSLPSLKFTCGYCGADIASEKGWAGNPKSFIYLCHQCNQPNYFRIDGRQFPGSAAGKEVNDIPDNSVKDLYKEARNCISSHSFTASVLCLRKLLMNIAVAKGAQEGKRFIEYVEYLSEQGFIPPDGKQWVDQIRTMGNDATHEIKIMKKEDAEELLIFAEMLLRFIYEFPARLKRKIGAN